MKVAYFKHEAVIEGEACGPVFISDPADPTRTVVEWPWHLKSKAKAEAERLGLQFVDGEEEMMKVPEVRAALERFDAFMAPSDAKKVANESPE